MKKTRTQEAIDKAREHSMPKLAELLDKINKRFEDIKIVEKTDCHGKFLILYFLIFIPITTFGAITINWGFFSLGLIGSLLLIIGYEYAQIGVDC